MKAFKYTLSFWFFAISCFITVLVFKEHFPISLIVVSKDETIVHGLLMATYESMLGILASGILCLFSYFVFVKIIFSDEIKENVFIHLKKLRNTGTTVSEPIEQKSVIAEETKH